MRRIFLFFYINFICWNVLIAGELDSLKRGVDVFKYSRVSFELNQVQYSETFSTKFTIVYMDSFYYIDSPDQQIFVTKDEIKTYNKNTNQLIIDNRMGQEFDIFSLFSGDLTLIKIINQNKKKKKGEIPFEVIGYDIRGVISVNAESWIPNKISFTYDQNNQIDLNILSRQYNFDVIHEQDFGRNAEEIIDLRE